MRILVYLYYPLFAEHLAGGLQVSTRSLIAGFIERGHQVRVLCPESDARPLFQAPGLEVLPVLREPRAATIDPADVSHNLNETRRAAEWADVVWSLDRALPAEVARPVMLSLSAVCYENELAALFGLTWDHLVVPSGYVRRLVDDWLPRESPRLGHRGRSSIPPPLDPAFRPQADTTALRSKLGFGFDRDHRYLLFPHRPEAGKGHELALQVLAELLRHDERFHLLIPRPPLSRRIDVASEANYIRRVEGEARRLGLADRVTFHDWVVYSDLPAYYSIGERCLFLSRLPEGFGLSLVQSIACGTPVVSSGMGALRETVPPGLGHIIAPSSDPAAVAQAVLTGCPESELRRGQEWVGEAYGSARIVGAYLDCFAAAARSRDTGRARAARA
ncbi:MAG TPA: glycosyltransferase family 4 protein [Terriglobia bacterium]|nr:glycosyltransferase family 4 protein [Terriglobia bacterium]